MQFFSYLTNGQSRCARLVGQFGIDLNLASQNYIDSFGASMSLNVTLPEDMIDFLRLGDEGINFSKTVTDWALHNLFGNQKWLAEGVIFEFNNAVLSAPVIRPGKVICMAGNYPTLDQLERPEFPVVFLKPSTGVIGHSQPVIIPAIAKSVAYEVELTIVIGRQGKNLSKKEAIKYIAGFTLANDLGDRLLEKRTSQWTSGKMFDTFTPMGPMIVTLDELSNTADLSMFTKVNGQIVQKGNTSQMFFDVPGIVAYISSLTTLEPGDVILTGSPKLMDGEPNPPCELKPGDVVEVGIENLGSLMNPIIAENR